MISLHHLFLALRAQKLVYAWFVLAWVLKCVASNDQSWPDCSSLVAHVVFLHSYQFMPASDGKETLLQIASAAMRFRVLDSWTCCILVTQTLSNMVCNH